MIKIMTLVYKIVTKSIISILEHIAFHKNAFIFYEAFDIYRDNLL